MSLSAAKSRVMQATTQVGSGHLDGVEATRANPVRDTAISGATPILHELERMLASDPFAGLDRLAANRKAAELHHLRSRVLDELSPAPWEDPEVLALMRRVELADEKVAVADAAWARAGLHAAIREEWTLLRADIAGWADESARSGPLEPPALPRTERAVHRVGQLLADPKTLRIRADNMGDRVIDAMYREAEGVLAAAAAKLDAAFHAVLDAAELMAVPAPEARYDLDRPRMLAGAAERALAGTPQQHATVVRAQRLDERWQAEVAAVRQARQDLYEKLAAEADAAWPGIVAATGAGNDIDLTDTGRVVLIRGHNRSGWDFHGGHYPFAMRLNGTPVGGHYEPYVRQALEHAWYELKLDVNDRVPWDVVGVVEGPGAIGERAVRTVRSAETHQEIGQVEEWPSVDCVRLRIIALHAGPVAVGPPES